MPALVGEIEKPNDWIQLRQKAQMWRYLHAQAVERASFWKKKAQELEKFNQQQQFRITRVTEQFEEVIRQLKNQNTENNQQIETLQARIAWLEKQLFGQKSEHTQGEIREDPGVDPTKPKDGMRQEEGENRKKRGKQRGTQGYGRKRHVDLPVQEIEHDLPQDQRRCDQCGKDFEVFPGSEDSEEIHWEMRLVRRVHKRKRYRRICQCKSVPGIVTAPLPPKLIPKGMFSVEFWVWILLEKFLFQRPLHRVGEVVALQGLEVSQGTLLGGLRRLEELLQPLYELILAQSRESNHWHWDETQWKVFVELEGKKGHQWWMWVVITDKTVVYLLEPTRSAEVPKKHLGSDVKGIISADRYVVYKSLGSGIMVAFCWSHMRRDFIEVKDTYKKLRDWGETWEMRINEIFRLNDQRLAVLSNLERFATADAALRAELACMSAVRQKELADPTIHPAQRYALQSQHNHWTGLVLFLDRPEIPMTNNEAERRIYDVALGRKNYYGSRSLWSGRLSAIEFTINETCLLHKIDPQKFHRAYFQACAQNGGRCPGYLNAWLPWNLTQEHKSAWRYPNRSP